MNLKKFLVPTVLVAVGVGSMAVAESNPDAKPAGAMPEMKLPAGWTMEDMQKCMLAGTPGKEHERLARDIGVWYGKTKMWMTPDSEPMMSESTCTISSFMDGRYVKMEMAGEMPGMGPFNGFGIHGFDNVSKKYVSTWVDNHSTGIMQGTGEMSADGKQLTWTFTYNCPITNKPTTMREVETDTGPNTKTLEMFGTDPKSGKEFKMMVLELTKKQ